MSKYTTENRFPSHNFPMAVFIVDEETGEETTHRLNYGGGKLTVSPVKAADGEPDKKTASVGKAAGPVTEAKPEKEPAGAPPESGTETV